MRVGLATIGACIGLTAGTARAGDVSQLQWLSGCWVQATGGQTVEEVWLSPQGGIALGLGRTTRDGRLRTYEFMRIEAIEGVPTFFAMPSGQAPASFPAIRQTADEIVFENTAQDFPQRIVYRRTDTGLHAHIEGPAGTGTTIINFDYTRCPQ